MNIFKATKMSSNVNSHKNPPSKIKLKRVAK